LLWRFCRLSPRAPGASGTRGGPPRRGCFFCRRRRNWKSM